MCKQSESDIKQLEKEVYNTLIELVDLAKKLTPDKLSLKYFNIDFGNITFWSNMLNVTMGDYQYMRIYEPNRAKLVLIFYKGGILELYPDTYSSSHIKYLISRFVEDHLDMVYYILRLPGILKSIWETYGEGR